jgi:hypothetical protein
MPWPWSPLPRGPGGGQGPGGGPVGRSALIHSSEASGRRAGLAAGGGRLWRTVAGWFPGTATATMTAPLRRPPAIRPMASRIGMGHPREFPPRTPVTTPRSTPAICMSEPATARSRQTRLVPAFTGPAFTGPQWHGGPAAATGPGRNPPTSAKERLGSH